MEPMGKQGARGALFQLTLLAYGYTFVGKGTVAEFTVDLNHEAAVYHRVQPLQGIRFPVFLGTVDLRHLNRTYYLDFRVRIVSLLLLSWGGHSLDEPETMETIGPDAFRDLLQSMQALHRRGVIHTDIRRANLVWSKESRRLMVIDFERALLLPRRRRVLAQVVSNRRTRTSSTEGRKAGPQQGLEIERRRREDLAAAKSIFKI